MFGRVDVLNPHWNRCAGQTNGPKTFRPTHEWLKERTSPEVLYLETKWASLTPFARVASLLKEVLPVGDSVNHQTIRKHLQATAERMELELGDERQLNLFEGSEEEWEQQPLPDGPMTVGIDGWWSNRRSPDRCALKTYRLDKLVNQIVPFEYVQIAA